MKSENKNGEGTTGRLKTKAIQTAHNLRAKKVYLVETTIKVQKQHLTEVTKRKKILFFSNGRDGAD